MLCMLIFPACDQFLPLFVSFDLTLQCLQNSATSPGGAKRGAMQVQFMVLFRLRVGSICVSVPCDSVLSQVTNDTSKMLVFGLLVTPHPVAGFCFQKRPQL